MGQKVHPYGMRVGFIRDWGSVWVADKKMFPKYLLEDYNIRKFIKDKLYGAGIGNIKIYRSSNRVRVVIFASRPGVIIGKSGQAIAKLTEKLQTFSEQKLSIEIKEIKNYDSCAQLVAEEVAKQLEARIAFRKAMKQSINRALKSMRVKGIKICVSGRLGGADMARVEHCHEGMIPLQTLRADIDYGFAEANTTYGKIGVKVWIYKGEILPDKKQGGEDKNVNTKKN